MKILVIADRINQLNPKSDTGISLAREAVNRGIDTFWTTADQVFVENLKPSCISYRIEKKYARGAAPKLNEESEKFRLEEFSYILVRKDPPFDQNYLALCWLLLCVARSQDKIFNAPLSLIKYHEKLGPLMAVAEGYLDYDDLIMTDITSESWSSTSISSDQIIAKDFWGYAGKNISLFENKSDLTAFLKKQSERLLVQPFQPEVKSLGDKRAFFISGKYCGVFTRLPKDGGFLSNLAQGGTAEISTLTKKEKMLCGKLEPFFKDNNIFLAGIDLMNEKISEINITAPTGFETHFKLYGEDLSKLFFDALLIKSTN